MAPKKRADRTRTEKTKKGAVAEYKIGLLNSTDKKDETADPLYKAFVGGLGALDFKIFQKHAEGKYGKRHRDLDAKAEELIKTDKVALIVAIGGIASARAAVSQADGKPVVACLGQIDPFDPLLHGAQIWGVNLNTPAYNLRRAALLTDKYSSVSEQTVCLIVNSNAPMGEKERKHWEGLGRPVVQTGTDGSNEESKLEPIIKAAAMNGVTGFIISSDPFFMWKRGAIINAVSETGLPACYPFKQYVDAGGEMSYGPDLLHAYEYLGKVARTILTSTNVPPPGFVNAQPVQFPQ